MCVSSFINSFHLTFLLNIFIELTYDVIITTSFRYFLQFHIARTFSGLKKCWLLVLPPFTILDTYWIDVNFNCKSESTKLKSDLESELSLNFCQLKFEMSKVNGIIIKLYV